MPPSLCPLRRTFAPLCLFLPLLGASHAVAAQSQDRVVLGAGVAYLPGFQGSDDYRTDPALLVDIRKGRFFATTADGIGFDLFSAPGFTLSASAAWMPGYGASDTPEGIGKLSDALGGRISAATQLGQATARLSATRALTESERGLQLDLRLSYPYRFGERLTVIPSLSVNWANADYMDSYFGIDADRAQRSGLPLHRASAGFKDVALRTAISYRFSEKWSVLGIVGVTRLMDEATDSPLVERETQASGALGLTYRF